MIRKIWRRTKIHDETQYISNQGSGLPIYIYIYVKSETYIYIYIYIYIYKIDCLRSLACIFFYLQQRNVFPSLALSTLIFFRQLTNEPPVRREFCRLVHQRVVVEDKSTTKFSVLWSIQAPPHGIVTALFPNQLGCVTLNNI